MDECKNCKSAGWSGFYCGLLAMFLGMLMILTVVANSIRHEAVRSGAAHYAADADGKSVFTWRDGRGCTCKAVSGG